MYTLSQIRSGLDSPKEGTVPQGLRGAIISILNEACNGDHGRKVILSWCFPETFEGVEIDKVSTKALSDRQWYALKRWIEPVNPMKGLWKSIRFDFAEECAEIWIDVERIEKV